MSGAGLSTFDPTLRWHTSGNGSLDWIALGEAVGGPQAFWGRYLQQLGSLLLARRALLLGGAVGQPWQAIAQWPVDARVADGDARLVQQAVDALPNDRPRVALGEGDVQVFAMRLPRAPAAADQVLALVFLRDGDGVVGDDNQGWLAWASVVAAVPAWWGRLSAAHAGDRERQSVGVDFAHPAVRRAETLHRLMQLSSRLWSHHRFMRQAIEVCGELAQQHGCDRVSLGWREGPYIQLKAISQIEKFDAKSAAVRALESAMEEAADQAGDLAHPLPDGARQVDRAHAAYARAQGTLHLLSVPLREGDSVCGVLTLERNAAAFEEDERWELGELAMLVVHPMARLHERDRWWGGRAWRRGAGEWLGPRHSAWKLGLGAVAVALVASVFTPWDFRVEGELSLRSKDVLFMPAPFDGYLKDVHVEMGETVRAGQVLASLDTRDLALEASMASADLVRFTREAEKAQATRQLADMQIMLARQQQAASRLALIEHQLTQARVVAPNDGIVVEGDLKKNLGAPLRKGDLLLKLAQTGEIVVEIAIDETDIHEVQVGTRGEFALVGRPDQRFVMTVDRIDPVASLRDGRNVYLARALHDGVPPDWWRPGMGGTARLDAGERALIWVLTYRTVRLVRQMFWI